MFGHLTGSFANAVISKLLWLGLLFDFAITGLATPLSEPSVKKTDVSGKLPQTTNNANIF